MYITVQLLSKTCGTDADVQIFICSKTRYDDTPYVFVREDTTTQVLVHNVS